MYSSCKLYENTTTQLAYLIQLVETQLTLSNSQDGETDRRSRGWREEPDLTRGRSRDSRDKAVHKNRKEKHLARSQSCAPRDKLSLDNFSPKLQNQEQKSFEKNLNEKPKNKMMRSKSTAFEFRDVIKPRIESINPEQFPASKDKDRDQTNVDVKHKSGKTLRRIKTFLRRPRKYQFESETNSSDSYKYCK